MIKEKLYVARIGAVFNNDEAQVFGEYLDSKQLKTPVEILKDAETNEASPFWSFLEWDDTEAAERFRVSQVRNIVNHISIEIVYIDGETITFDRAYEIVSVESGREYIHIEEGLADKDIRMQIIRRALSNLQGWRKRYGEYKEFAGIAREIDALSETF